MMNARFLFALVWVLVVSAATAQHRFELTPTQTDPFVAVSFIVTGPDAQALSHGMLSWRTEDGWSDPVRRPFDAHGPADVAWRGIPPYEVPPDASAVRLDLDDADVEVDVHVFHPGFTAPETGRPSFGGPLKSGLADSCACPRPPLQQRDDWCPAGDCDHLPYTPTATTHLIVHHSAGSNTAADWAAVVRSIWDFHVNVNGWDDIGYNFLVDPDGIVYEGRGEDVIGAHFSCMNGTTMGICLLGNYETASPSPESLQAIEELTAYKLCLLHEAATDTVYHPPSELDLPLIAGHRDGNSSPSPASCASGTVCPGANLYAALPGLRADAFDHQVTCADSLNPDIVVLTMDHRPISGAPGLLEDDTTWLRFEARNVGDADITDTIPFRYRINGVNVDTGFFVGMAAGETKADSLLWSFPTVGTQSFCVFIDGMPGEPSVLNNSFCIPIETRICGGQSNIARTTVGYTEACVLYALVMTGDTTDYDWQWMLDGASIPGATDDEYGPLSAPGDYQLIMIDGVCRDTSEVFFIGPDECGFTVVRDLDQQAFRVAMGAGGVRVVPAVPGSRFEARLIDLTGRELRRATGLDEVVLSVDGLSSGVHVVQVWTDRGVWTTTVVLHGLTH
mgnify:FL=1